MVKDIIRNEQDTLLCVVAVGRFKKRKNWPKTRKVGDGAKHTI